jgi:hypothetical protein
MDLDRVAIEFHGEDSSNKSRDEDDPFAEGNYIPRA